MSTQNGNTVEFHRILKATAGRVYRAFTCAGAFAKWLPPYGYFATVQAMDCRVGGRYRMSFTNLGTGREEAFGGEYLELEPGRRIRYTADFEDASLPGRMRTTVTLREVACGVEVRITQDGIPAAIPVEMCYLGWQESLEQLARLVEPAIRD